MVEHESDKIRSSEDPQLPPPSSSAMRSASELNAAPAISGDSEKYLSSAKSPNLGHTNRCVIAIIVYFALLLDNVLLTVIVPILPDYLATINNDQQHNPAMKLKMFNYNNNNNNFNDTSTAALSVGIANGGSPFIVPPNLAYRYIDGPQQSMQTIMTKHPIPGKSMVNFTLPPQPLPPAAESSTHSDDKAIYTPTEHKQHLQYTSTNTGANGIPRGKIAEADNSINKFVTIAESSNNNNNNNGNSKAPLNRTDSDDSLNDENSSVGILLSMKALVQLIFNPIVGSLTTKFGYRLPIVAGTCMLLISSLVFSVGETYMQLLIARAIQGIASACISVCGMSLVAQHYPEEERRSKVMGIILGSIALGVLLGYPFGSILYDFIGKSAPFIILSTVSIITEEKKSKWRPLLENRMILAIVVAIWFSTSTMSLLEPCLPIWLIQHLHPSKWQLGTVFIPDSVGYFVGTNFFGTFAYKNGQVKVSCLALLLVGFSAILVPSATTVGQLLLPHFGLGLGIGIIDAALVPMLATFVDATLAQEIQAYGAGDGSSGGNGNSMSSYGAVYAIQQTSVSLAYCFAPLLGGELAQAIGFAWLMRIVGFCNIAYGPVLVCIYQKYNSKYNHNELLLSNSGRGSEYKKLYNSLDIE